MHLCFCIYIFILQTRKIRRTERRRRRRVRNGDEFSGRKKILMRKYVFEKVHSHLRLHSLPRPVKIPCMITEKKDKDKDKDEKKGTAKFLAKLSDSL